MTEDAVLTNGGDYPVTIALADATGNIDAGTDLISLTAGRYLVMYQINIGSASVGTYAIMPLVNSVAQSAYRASATAAAGDAITLSGSFVVDSAVASLLSFAVAAPDNTTEADVVFTVIKLV